MQESKGLDEKAVEPCHRFFEKAEGLKQKMINDEPTVLRKKARQKWNEYCRDRYWDRGGGQRELQEEGAGGQGSSR